MAGLVFRISSRKAYFALGDGDRFQERDYGNWLFREAKSELRSAGKIWKAGHHGSRHSSDPDFLALLEPTEVWVSVGARNPYGHPNAEALARLAHSGAGIHRTDVEGDLAASSIE